MYFHEINISSIDKCLAMDLVRINGQPADKRDLMTKSQNLQVMHILNILSM